MTMPVEQPATPKPKLRWYQYSLRTLLEITAVISLGGSLWRWGGETISRTPEFYVGLAVVLIATGLYIRRWTWILGGMVVVMGVLLGTSIYQQHAAKHAADYWQPRQISLLVVDSQMIPVAKAHIRISYSRAFIQKNRNAETMADGGCTIDVAMRYHANSIDLDGSPCDYAIDPQACNEIDIQIDATGFKPFHRTLSDCLKSQGLSDISRPKPIIILLTK
jgi:hypothetical protein